MTQTDRGQHTFFHVQAPGLAQAEAKVRAKGYEILGVRRRPWWPVTMGETGEISFAPVYVRSGVDEFGKPYPHQRPTRLPALTVYEPASDTYVVKCMARRA